MSVEGSIPMHATIPRSHRMCSSTLPCTSLPGSTGSSTHKSARPRFSRGVQPRLRSSPSAVTESWEPLGTRSVPIAASHGDGDLASTNLAPADARERAGQAPYRFHLRGDRLIPRLCIPHTSTPTDGVYSIQLHPVAQSVYEPCLFIHLRAHTCTRANAQTHPRAEQLRVVKLCIRKFARRESSRRGLLYKYKYVTGRRGP